MIDPELQFCDKYIDYVVRRNKAHQQTYIFRGGRRSGKTWFIAWLLLCRAYNGKIVNVASMTKEQGRNGVFADMKDILRRCPKQFGSSWEAIEMPREVRFHNGRNGKIIFNSYKASETAKGVACDDLYINECNNFTQQQYTDLCANVRYGTYIDFNPNIEFWVNDMWTDDDICDTTWQDNKKNLTESQLDYFAKLKEMAERPDASPLDIRNYNIYYLGKFSELRGQIFSPENLTFVSEMPSPGSLYDVRVFCDPSALRGADWFACVLSAKCREDGKVYILDTFSTNQGSREMICHKLREWCGEWDGVTIYVEGNGIIGIDFFDFAVNSGLPVEYWYSRGNKFERIIGNYQNFVEEVVFVETDHLAPFMSQVYEFDTKCEHDDNVDALNTSYNIQKYY